MANIQEHNKTPKRPVPELKSQNTSSTNKETSRPFRPERGYEVTGVVGSSDEDREDTPPKGPNVPYDAERARRDKLTRKAERKAQQLREEERRQTMMQPQTRGSTSPTRQTSKWDNRKPQEERKKSPSRPPRGPNEYKKTYNTGSADRSHRNYRDY